MIEIGGTFIYTDFLLSKEIIITSCKYTDAIIGKGGGGGRKDGLGGNLSRGRTEYCYKIFFFSFPRLNK